MRLHSKAETDATKRALATFGNPFRTGALRYGTDRVTGQRSRQLTETGAAALRATRNEGNEASFLTPQTFADVAIAEIRELIWTPSHISNATKVLSSTSGELGQE
jgi:hypothetical protein